MMHKRIKKLLIDNDMTQGQLAKKVNTTEANMSRYCRGERIPNAVMIGKIAKELHTTTDYLIFGGQDYGKFN